PSRVPRQGGGEGAAGGGGEPRQRDGGIGADYPPGGFLQWGRQGAVCIPRILDLGQGAQIAENRVFIRGSGTDGFGCWLIKRREPFGRRKAPASAFHPPLFISGHQQAFEGPPHLRRQWTAPLLPIVEVDQHRPAEGDQLSAVPIRDPVQDGKAAVADALHFRGDPEPLGEGGLRFVFAAGGGDDQFPFVYIHGGIEHSEQFGPSRLHVSVVDGVVDMTQRVAFVETNLQRGNQRHMLSSLFGS